MLRRVEVATIVCISATVAIIVLLVGFTPGPLGSGAPAAQADTGFPDTITAVYDGNTGLLTAEGTYSWPECPKNRAAGFALFIEGATPDNPGTGALDGSDASDTMHPANMSAYVFPCDTSGSWGPDSHALASAPIEVCVVIYDLHMDKQTGQAKTTGNHSTVGASADDRVRNKDNSYEENEGAHADGACVEPTINHAEGDLSITKSADEATTGHGDTIAYTFNVTYTPGPDGSPAQSIVVTDPRCTSAITRGADSPGNGDDLLEAGETWVYTCTSSVAAHSNGEADPILNVAHVEGEDLDGDPVTPADSNEVSVDILHEPAPVPTPTPAPTPTPTPQPTALAATQRPSSLPDTGGEPSGDSDAWLAAIAGALAMIAGGGVWLAYQGRRLR